MSSKRPHQSSDDDFDEVPSDVRRFIDDMAQESGGEDEFDNDEGDPDQTQFFVDDDGETVDESDYPSGDHHPTRWSHAEDEAAEALRQAKAIAQRYISQREVSVPASELDSEPMHQAAQRDMYMYCIDVPARLADNYVNQLQAINSLPQFQGRNVVYAPFAPLHHLLPGAHPYSKHRKVYFFMSKEVSYDTIRFSSVFLPAGSTSDSLVVTPTLPPSYTIVPINEWTAFTSVGIPAGSLVRIRANGVFRGALGYVIGASTNAANECALVAVIPKIKYPTLPNPADSRHVAPAKKRTKIRSPPDRPNLFDPHRLIIRDSADEASSSSKYAVVYQNGFERFFKTEFPSVYANGEEHRLDLDSFSFRVRQREVDSVASLLSKTVHAEVHRIPPVYQYRGHLYYLGTRILPIFHRLTLDHHRVFQVHEVLPFVESRLAPDVFDPLISQLHWKEGDKLVDVAQTDDYPFYRINRVDLEDGVVIAYQVLTPYDEEDAQNLRSSSYHVDNNRLPHEYTISAFRLRLIVGDNVRVIAGEHKTAYGTVTAAVSDEGYVCITPAGAEMEKSLSITACWLETSSGPDVILSTHHQQSVIRPDVSVDRSIAHDQVDSAAIQDYYQLIDVDDPKRDRGMVTEVYDNAFVQLRLIDGTYVVLPPNRLKSINPGFLEFQHPAIGKQVLVMAKKNASRGLVGTALSHNVVFNTFQVAFPTYVATFNAQELWLDATAGQHICVDRQHGPPITMKLSIAPNSTARMPTPRMSTPPFQEPPRDAATPPFDVVASGPTIREPTKIDFLAEPWATSLSRTHHFYLYFLPGHIVASMVDRQCTTICPSQFSFENDRITVQYVDRKNAKHTESVLCQYLAPHSPQKGGGSVVFIEGARAGLVCSVKKAKRVDGTLDLVSIEEELIKKQNRLVCCGVEAHAEPCRCSTFPPL